MEIGNLGSLRPGGALPSVSRRGPACRGPGAHHTSHEGGRANHRTRRRSSLPPTSRAHPLPTVGVSPLACFWHPGISCLGWVCYQDHFGSTAWSHPMAGGRKRIRRRWRTAADCADAAALLHALRANPTSAHPPSGSTLLDRARATALASPARSRAATAAAGNPFAATIRVPVSFETCVNPSLLANRLDEEAVLKPRCKPRYS